MRKVAGEFPEGATLVEKKKTLFSNIWKPGITSMVSFNRELFG